MRFRSFERTAREMYDSLPQEYRRGIDGLVVSRDAVAHPDNDAVSTLGECLTESHISDFGGPDTIRSTIVLYWGSFRSLAARDPHFDWRGETWETLTHELRHHLESLAGEDALERIDYAVDEGSARFTGKSFDPWYYRGGEEIAPRVFRIEGDVYIELEAGTRRFHWDGVEYAFSLPEDGSRPDVRFVSVDGVAGVGGRGGPRTIEIALVRRRTLRDLLRGLLRQRPPTVDECRATAVRLERDGAKAVPAQVPMASPPS